MAGLVPCAESGTMTRWRFSPSPRERCQARMSRIPVSSPCAPAAGWVVTAANPVMVASRSCTSAITRRQPCVASSPASGCAPANPGWAASSSSMRGLCFMVHDPSG